MKILQKLIATGLIALLNLTSIAQASETVTYFHNDLLGSPAAATDESGEIIWRENYRPFGEKVKNQDEKTDNVIGYTGHVHDEDTGLTYMQARYYDPVIGRFYANDPVGFVQSNPLSFNRYAYANNNPYKFVDPDGNFAFLAIPAYTLAEYAVVAILGAIVAKGIEEEIVTPAIQAHMNKDEQSEEVAEPNGIEKKGQGQPEVGDCPECGGDTSTKPGKIGKAHDLKPKEVKDRIHGVKNGQLEGNPDVEVCNDCGEVFPQTEDGGLGDSIGNILDDEY